MKTHISQLISQAIESVQQTGTLPADLGFTLQIERTRDKSHGDYACNIAMQLAKVTKTNPRAIAEQLVAHLPASDSVVKVEVAGPGFINFYISTHTIYAVVATILEQAERFGHSSVGAGKKVQVEFVSANPTGPLHVGHGRGAAYGAAVSDLLAACGFNVHREYYVNDAGRQMDILCASVWIRYLSLCDALAEADYLPANGYKGDYVWDVAARLHRENGEKFKQLWSTVSEGLPRDEADGGDKEKFIDAVIARAKDLLGADDYRFVFDTGLKYILDDIRDDLEHFGVNYDEWYSERSLTDSDAVTRAVERLKASGHTYEKDGALWFKSTDYGDEKDRVLVRDNGATTYFASDIAYHMDKMERGFDRVIDVWGADHHGYVPRVKAALQALGDDADKLDVLLVQFAVLYRGGQKMQMSTRSGEFVTLRQLRKEVGSDAARFFYVMRKCEQHLDFDLDLAMSQSNDNPMYYIQYAHARVSSVFRQLAEKKINYDQASGLQNLTALTEQHELDLLNALSKYVEIVENAALKHEPHQLAHYLRDLANAFHTYYNAHQFIVDDDTLRHARLCLISATKQVLANGLGLLGVSAPDSM